jgi:hypothetical protein
MDASRVGTEKDLPPIRTLAQWIVSAAKDQPYKHLLHYADLRDILQCDPQGRRGRSAILRAQRVLLDDHNKYLACVTGKGYEIAHPSEHADYVQRLRRAGIRKVTKAHRVSVRVDISGLSADELRTLTVQQTKTGAMLGYMRRIESRRKLTTVRQEIASFKAKDIAKAITGVK